VRTRTTGAECRHSSADAFFALTSSARRSSKASRSAGVGADSSNVESGCGMVGEIHLVLPNLGTGILFRDWLRWPSTSSKGASPCLARYSAETRDYPVPSEQCTGLKSARDRAAASYKRASLGSLKLSPLRHPSGDTHGWLQVTSRRRRAVAASWKGIRERLRAKTSSPFQFAQRPFLVDLAPALRSDHGRPPYVSTRACD